MESTRPMELELYSRGGMDLFQGADGSYEQIIYVWR